MEKKGKQEEGVLSVIEPQAPIPIANIISMAVQGGADIEQLEKLMALHERHEKNEAQKAYHVAMAAFKADPPKINKDASVSYQAKGGTTSYKHAKLATMCDKINVELSKHGLSAAWKINQEKGIAVTCTITHVMGHSESTTLEAGADESGGKNKIQAIGSTVTYLQRYTLKSLTGLAEGDDDDDGVGSEAEYISEEQIKEINKLAKKVSADIAMFKTFMKVESIDKILSSDYNRAIKGLEAKERKVNK